MGLMSKRSSLGTPAARQVAGRNKRRDSKRRDFTGATSDAETGNGGEGTTREAGTESSGSYRGGRDWVQSLRQFNRSIASYTIRAIAEKTKLPGGAIDRYVGDYLGKAEVAIYHIVGVLLAVTAAGAPVLPRRVGLVRVGPRAHPLDKILPLRLLVISLLRFCTF